MHDQIATNTGVVVVNTAISFPCKNLKAFIKAKYIIPNWITPIIIAVRCFLKVNFLKNGKKINAATSSLQNTTNSLGKTLNWSFISPKDKEKHTVAITR